MAFIPLFRVIIFSAITVSALVVLGICAHIESLIAGYTTDGSLVFVPLGLAAACLTVVSLPLFLVLGKNRVVFTSMILFEIIWFFLLWVLWVGTAGASVVGKSTSFPLGCVYDNYPTANQYCYEFTVVEAFAFLNFFLAFVYYDVVFLYAIINAIRGRGIWTVSVKEAANITSAPFIPGVPMTQPQFNGAPGVPYQNYGQFPPQQGYNVPPHQGYPQQAYPQQVPPQGPPMAPMAQQPYNYPPSPGTPQQPPNFAGYSPSAPSVNNAPLPPQPNYAAYPTNGSQGQLPLPGGYPGQPVSPQPQVPYGSPHAIPV